MSDFVRPHRWQPTKLPCPWDSPGKNSNGFPFPSPMRESEKVKVKSLSPVRLLAIPWTAAYHALCPWDFPGRSTGVPLPSPVIREWSATVVADGLIAIHTLFKQYLLRALRGILMNLHKDSIRYLILFLVLFIFKISIYIFKFHPR